MKTIPKLLAGIIVLILLTPFGLLLPVLFKASAAWGEWGDSELKKLIGYVPQGMAKVSGLWHAPLTGYSFEGWREKGILHHSLSYILSALAGVAIIAAITIALGKLLTKNNEKK
jgi:hypothetical protein